MAALATQPAERHPQRCLWASNGPHPNVRPELSNAPLLDRALQQVPGVQAQLRLLVDNRAEPYGF